MADHDDVLCTRVHRVHHGNRDHEHGHHTQTCSRACDDTDHGDDNHRDDNHDEESDDSHDDHISQT